MKHIVLFGAGKSATVLIDYLKNLATEKRWIISIVDSDIEIVKLKAGNHPLLEPLAFDINDIEKRKELIKTADLVISMLPPALHFVVAVDCAEFGRHLLTASYVDEKIKGLAARIEEKNVLFLCEMGLDPGIDHMSAMQIIDRVKASGGKVTSFKSHCGGLVAPESDDNPWHYKISWNPRNIVMAGKDGAVYKENGLEKSVAYADLFNNTNLVTTPDQVWAWYANRNSLSYLSTYGLHNVETFVRTTLRHPDFCFGWKNIIDLKLTSEEKIYDTNGMTVSEFFRQHFQKHGFAEWLNNLLSTRLTYARKVMEDLLKLTEEEDEQTAPKDDIVMLVNQWGELDTLEVDELKNRAAATVASRVHEANLSLKQLSFLGLDSDELIDKGLCSAADVLQFVIEKKLALRPEDKDMIVMIHEIGYEINGKKSRVHSSLIVKGENSLYTAMAKTVGLPLGIVARLILEGKIKETGLQIPVSPNIYNPVLDELQKHGISFEEISSEDAV